MSNRSISYAGIALALLAFLITFDWGESNPDQLSASEALTTSAAVYIMVFVVLKLFAWLISKLRD
ncbi:MAG: hypothetical protein ACO3DX_00190 [Candidatus Nanopelagicales bacterium]